MPRQLTLSDCFDKITKKAKLDNHDCIATSYMFGIYDYRSLDDKCDSNLDQVPETRLPLLPLFNQFQSPFSNKNSTIFPLSFSGIQQQLTFASPQKKLSDFHFQPHNSSSVKSQCATVKITSKLKTQKLDKWIIKKNLYLTNKLPKEIMYKIYSFLTLTECANTSMVCRYWWNCYQNIYVSYSFFKEFDLDRFSEKELKSVFKNAGSNMRHIRKISEILKGQRLGPLKQKTSLYTTLTRESERDGQLLETFRFAPKRAANISVFLTDKAVRNICSESYDSLQFISLVSCQFVTGSAFETMKMCSNLRYICIMNNSNFQDANLEEILRNLNGLNTLIVSNCSGLSSDCLEVIARHCEKLERLDVGNNQQIQFYHCGLFSRMKNLQSLSLKQTSVTNSQIQEVVGFVPKLHSLNLEGCLCLSDLTLRILKNSRLRLERLNVNHSSQLEEEGVYELCVGMASLKLVIVNSNLMSWRVERVLRSRM